VQATDIFGRVSSDTVQVSYPAIELPANQSICYGNELDFGVMVGQGYSYLWSTGETSNTITITEGGNYWVRIFDNSGCSIEHAFTVDVDMFPLTASLGNDKVLCNGNRIVLESGAGEAITYQWSNGSTFPWFVVNGQSEVSVTVTNVNGCVAVDTVQIVLTGEAPLIAFDHTIMCRGSQFSFSDLSQTIDGSIIDNRRWIFNQEDTLFGASALYTYPDTGQINVNLLVSTSAGCFQDTSFTARVNDIPVALFTPSTACERSPVLFQSISTVSDGEISQWNWNINNATYTTSGFVHTFPAAGQATISLTVVSDKGCSGSKSTSFTVKNAPTADFTFESGCDGLPVLFTNQSQGWLGTSLDYLWIFDAQTQSTSVSPQHRFTGTGSYPVKLVATQRVNQCRDTIVKTVVVSPNPVSVPLNAAVCATGTVDLADNSIAGAGQTIVSRTWNINGAAGVIESNSLQTRDTSGTFAMQLTVTNSAGCISTGLSQLILHEKPKAEITTVADTVYIPTTLSLSSLFTSPGYNYRWYINDQYLSAEPTISQTASVAGQLRFGLAIETNLGCYDSATRVVAALVPSIDLEVASLSAVISNGQILIRPVLKNNGTVPLSQFVMNVRFNNLTAFSEIFESTLYPGTEQGYTLRTRVNAPESNSPVYVCLDAVTLQNDQNPANNSRCFLFEDNTRIFTPYPNPVRNEIAFEVISDVESVADISIVNSGGLLLWEGKLDIASGLTQLIIPTPAGATSVVYLKVRVNSKTQTFRILVNR
jgi:PKD repeat protein